MLFLPSFEYYFQEKATRKGALMAFIHYRGVQGKTQYFIWRIGFVVVTCALGHVKFCTRVCRRASGFMWQRNSAQKRGGGREGDGRGRWLAAEWLLLRARNINSQRTQKEEKVKIADMLTPWQQQVD